MKPHNTLLIKQNTPWFFKAFLFKLRTLIIVSNVCISDFDYKIKLSRYSKNNSRERTGNGYQQISHGISQGIFY